MSRSEVRLYLGADHACGYLPRRSARSVFVDPRLPLDAVRYGALLDLGFRRSGGYVYRPACAGCQACVPVRIPAREFVASRAQRRCLRRNADLTLSISSELTGEHFALYRRYLSARHPGGGMNPDDRASFHAFLECVWSEAQVWSWRLGGRLLAGAVVDRVPLGLSAVYSYYDPIEPQRGLGTLAILEQVEHARRAGLPYVYLGYWVAGSPKMDYKRQFRPLEALLDGQWRRLDDKDINASTAAGRSDARTSGGAIVAG